MITQEDKERVREAADIAQIIGEHVKLRRVGTSWRGPCPFHQGTKPNFSVNPKTGGYKCFVCGEHGDVFTFLQKRLGMDFVTAVRTVADKVGIVLEETSARRDAPDPREPIWELNAAAAEFFTRMLRDDAGAAAARQYLETRAIAPEVADRFGFGWAPRDGAVLRRHLEAVGYDADRQLEAGLLVRRDDGELRARFRDRLMFPIHDVAGRTVGFGGRILGAGDVKYLNSAESPVFSKGKLLYGLHWAKGPIRRAERAIVVEGYFDLIRLVASGIEEVVAPLGTALTEAQAEIVARYTKSVHLLYDSDEAGHRATFRAADVLLARGLAVQVVTLPDGEDPDSFVAARGPDALRARLDRAVDVFERKIQLLQQANWFADLRRKRRAVDRLLPTIRATADAVTRDLYIAKLSDAAGIPVETVRRELEESPGRRGPGRAAQGRRAGAAPEPDVETGGPPAPGDRRVTERRARPSDAVEHDLVLALLVARQHVDSVAERIAPEWLRHPAYRRIYEELVAAPDADLARLAAALDPEDEPLLHALLAGADAIVDPDRTVADIAARFQVRALQRESVRIQRLLAVASADEKNDLLVRKRAIADEIGALQGKGARWFAMKRPA